MRIRLALAGLVLSVASALAQNPGVQVQGSVTANHCVKFVNRALIADTGSACASGSPSGPAGGDLAGTYPNPTLNTSISTAVAFTGLGATNLLSASVFSWNNALKLSRDSDTALALGAGSSAAKSFTIYGTYTDASNNNFIQISSHTTTNSARITVDHNGSTANNGDLTFGISGNDVLALTNTSIRRVMLRNNAVLAWSSTGAPNDTPATQLTSPTTATLQLGAAAADTTGVSQTLQAQGVTTGGTNNQAGGDFSLKPGQGKGNVGATLRLFGATLGASGNTLQTMTEVVAVAPATTAPVWKWSANNSTGAGSAALGANSPAVTLTAPYTWITVITSDGSTGYMPVWK